MYRPDITVMVDYRRNTPSYLLVVFVLPVHVVYALSSTTVPVLPALSDYMTAGSETDS